VGNCLGRKKEEFKDLTSMKFNHLKVISLIPNKTNKHCDRYWLCECDCENKTRKEIAEPHLIKGNIKSCGCLTGIGITNKNKERAFTHLYPYYKNIKNSYDAMKKRCYDEKHDSYKNYGGRGITICDEWLDNYMNFYNWAIKNSYQDGLTIERIDYNGNYEPDNCRWATWKEQSYNKSNTIYITLDNETKTIGQWSDETGLSYSLIHQRYFKFNKKTKEELFKPLNKINKKRKEI